jgi:hypothetical protein
MLDVLLEYPIASDRSDFSVRPGFERLGLRVLTVLRFVPPGGPERAFEFAGDPGLVRLDPRWHQAALRFVESGFFHILDGPDHLLFLACLVIPFRRFRELVLVVTSFTVAHSITLIASAYGLGPDALWFPPLIEMLIALSILYMVLENIVGGANVQRRWMITFAFGLVHGFGFSFLLRETLQFAGSAGHHVAAILAQDRAQLFSFRGHAFASSSSSFICVVGANIADAAGGGKPMPASQQPCAVAQQPQLASWPIGPLLSRQS